MEKYPAVPLESNFLLENLPLADSESPPACLPSPAAHPPIRPGSSPPMPTSLPGSHTCAQGGGNSKGEHRAATAAGIASAAGEISLQQSGLEGLPSAALHV